MTARHQGDHAAARALTEESLAIYRELGGREGIANSLNNLGQVVAARGDLAAAQSMHAQSLAIYRELGDQSGIATSIEGLAGIALALAKPRRAACLWGAMKQLRDAIGAPLMPSERPHYDRQVAAARVAPGDDAAFDAAWQKGHAMTLEQAIAYVLGHDDA